MSKFARFDLDLDEQQGFQNLKVNVYEKDFVAKFREVRFDPSVWSALVDHFNRTGQGRVAVGKVYSATTTGRRTGCSAW